MNQGVGGNLGSNPYGNKTFKKLKRFIVNEKAISLFCLLQMLQNCNENVIKQKLYTKNVLP